MRILFVDNLLFDGEPSQPVFDLQPHLGLLSLVSVARCGGVEADIFDPKLALVRGLLQWNGTLYEDAASLILERRPDVIGFTALGCNFHCVVQIAREIHRRRPALPLLLGGPHASILHREILERLPYFIAIARHEAEETLLPLLAALGSDRIADVPGVSWRRADGQVVCNVGTPKIEDLDTLPVPAFDHQALEGRNLSSIRVEAGRGCPFSCSFCSTASFFGRSYRLKSPARLAAEMDLLAEHHGFGVFKLNHDLFTVSRRKVLEFCEEIASRSYRWACSARVDCVDADLLEAMQAAGCRSIYFGIETGSEAVQQSSRKRLDIALVEPTLASTRRLGIDTTTSFIIGYPDETEVDRAETLDMAGRLHTLPGNTSQIHLLTPEPGTAMLDQYRATLRFDKRRCGLNLPCFLGDDERLISAEPDLFVTHFHYPGIVRHSRNVFASSFWRQLAAIGRPAYSFLLDRWQGRLSQLLDEAEAWWSDLAGAETLPGPDALTEFARAIFGKSAPIVSLLRFENACRAGPAAGQALPSESRQPQSVQLAAAASVLRDVHNIPALGNAVLTAGERACTHLVVVRADDGAPAQAYEIDDITADLLTLLNKPGGDDVLSHVDPAAIAQLVALRIITPPHP
jgi:radical SAM superfamily enzyme YgiQ (UPF0313 family)